MLNVNKIQLSIYYTMAIKRESFPPVLVLFSQTKCHSTEALYNLSQKIKEI